MKTPLRTFLTVYTMLYIVICFTIIYYSMYIALVLGGMTIYLILLGVLILYAGASLIWVFNFTSSLNFKLENTKRNFFMFDSYRCIKSVVMNGDGEVTFTKGNIYTPSKESGDGYTFLNNNLQDHHIPEDFLDKHFKLLIP